MSIDQEGLRQRAVRLLREKERGRLAWHDNEEVVITGLLLALDKAEQETRDLTLEMSYLAHREYDDNPGRAFDNRRKLARSIAQQLQVSDAEAEAMRVAASEHGHTGAGIIRWLVEHWRTRAQTAEREKAQAERHFNATDSTLAKTTRELSACRDALRQATRERDEARKAQQLVADVLADYSDELDKAACDRCEQCNELVMCSFHSVLSALQRHTWTNGAIERDNLRRRAEAAESRLRALTEPVQESR